MSITPQEALQRTIEHREIFFDEMVDLMRQVMRGEVSPTMTAAILTGLRVKKETVGEIAGAATVMPLGSPIGSNRGLETRPLIQMLIEHCRVPVVVDAGIGRPSQAAAAMEMGADAVLVNTAIATARDPEAMGRAFDLAVKAGRAAYLAEMADESTLARASSPLTGFLDA